jgi:molybdate transport system substrate-binding protein
MAGVLGPRCARRIFSLVLCVVASVPGASAAEIHVMVSGGFTAPYNRLVARFERETGHHVITTYGASMGDTPTAIPNRLARGEAADVVILARGALDRLAKDGHVVDGSQVDLARSRIGLAVRAGTRPPVISSEAALRQVLLGASAIAYSSSASGVYVSRVLFARLGIAEQIAGKAKMSAGTPVGELVARGEADVGFQQMSELLPVAGIIVLGPIPESLQQITVFAAGLSATVQAPDASRQLVAFLVSNAARPTILECGLEPVKPAAP